MLSTAENYNFVRRTKFLLVYESCVPIYYTFLFF